MFIPPPRGSGAWFWASRTFFLKKIVKVWSKLKFLLEHHYAPIYINWFVSLNINLLLYGWVKELWNRHKFKWICIFKSISLDAKLNIFRINFLKLNWLWTFFNMNQIWVVYNSKPTKNEKLSAHVVVWLDSKMEFNCSLNLENP